MIPRKNPLSLVLDYLSKSISRMIMFTFILVLSFPLVFLLPSLNENIWDDVRSDNLVKHNLLAINLVELIKLEMSSHQNSLESLDNKLQAIDISNQNSAQLLINDFVNNNQDVIAVTLLLTQNGSLETKVFQLSQDYTKPTAELEYIESERRYRIYDTENSISSVFKSAISIQPAVLLKHHIINNDNNKIGTLFVETNLGHIKQICKQISFGENGHCVIVDNKGKAVAHPNPAWVSQMKNFSRDEITTQLKRESSGTLDYVSTVYNEAMIAGFAKVDSLDWGVMIFRPKVEIDSPFAGIKTAIFIWVTVGVLFALFTAFFVTRIITRPLNTLVDEAKKIDVRSETYRLGEVPARSPIEIKLLWRHLAKLIADFQEANSEVKSLSGSLNKDLRNVVLELRESNIKKTRNLDLLTGITNKECFISELRKTLQVHKGEEMGVILYNIENYDTIVTKCGQSVGNDVLKYVANILSNNIRGGDMAVRYDDKSCFAVYINSNLPKVLKKTAKKLYAQIVKNPMMLDNKQLHIKLSIALVIETINEELTVDSLMINAERILNKSKS